MGLSGRRVRQYFSNEHLVQGLLNPLGQSDFGFVVHRIEAVDSTVPLTVEFLPEVSRLRSSATDSTFQPSCVQSFSTPGPCAVFIAGKGDASAEFLNSTSLQLQAFTYHDFTVFQRADASLTSLGRGILAVQGFQSNFRVTQPLAVEDLTLQFENTDLRLSWTGTAVESLQLESSDDLQVWTPQGPPFAGTLGSNSRLFKEDGNRATFLRLSRN